MSNSESPSSLRQRAQEIVRKTGDPLMDTIDALSPDETRQLVHELHVHQIELEMQNEELRRAQAELDASQQRYFDLYDLAPVGYLILSEKGIILESNLTAATLLGVAREEMASKPLSRFILQEDQEIYYRFVRQLSKAGELQSCELRMLKKEGAAFWAQLDVTAEHIVDGASVRSVVLSNISERKRMETALQESEEKYRIVFNNEIYAICIFDLETFKLLDVNDAFVRLYGYHRDELISRMTINDITVEREKSELATRRASREGTIFIPLRHHRKKDGTVIPVEIVGGPYVWKGKKVMFGLIHDISERTEAELQREKLEAQNRQLQKSESLGRMAGSIAHHFNNQLQVVMMNLNFAMRGKATGEFQIENLTGAMEAAHKAAEVSSLMLTYLGQTIVKLQPLGISDVCLQSLPLIRAAMPKEVALETDLPVPGPCIHGNANQMQQVLTNLITNAWEACAGGKVSIRLAVRTVSAVDIPAVNRFPIGFATQASAYACLEVADTGCGIDSKDIEKLCDPFYSSKFTGRGLGLAVVLGIVRAHAGVVTVESKLGRGSVFRVFLPASADVLSLKPVPVFPSPQRIGGGTVLVVDDEMNLLKVVATAIKSMGFKVLTAQDGVEAVELFRQHQGDIRLVICDLSMPRMDGWQTLSALRKIAPDVMVILASGYNEAQVMAGDHPELPQAFLRKPFEFDQLSGVLFRVLDRNAVTKNKITQPR